MNKINIIKFVIGGVLIVLSALVGYDAYSNPDRSLTTGTRASSCPNQGGSCSGACSNQGQWCIDNISCGDKSFDTFQCLHPNGDENAPLEWISKGRDSNANECNVIAECGGTQPSGEPGDCQACIGSPLQFSVNFSRPLRAGEQVKCTVASTNANCKPCCGLSLAAECTAGAGASSCHVANNDCTCNPHEWSCTYNGQPIGGGGTVTTANDHTGAASLDLPEPQEPTDPPNCPVTDTPLYCQTWDTPGQEEYKCKMVVESKDCNGNVVGLKPGAECCTQPPPSNAPTEPPPPPSLPPSQCTGTEVLIYGDDAKNIFYVENRTASEVNVSCVRKEFHCDSVNGDGTGPQGGKQCSSKESSSSVTIKAPACGFGQYPVNCTPGCGSCQADIICTYGGITESEGKFVAASRDCTTPSNPPPPTGANSPTPTPTTPVTACIDLTIDGSGKQKTIKSGETVNITLKVSNPPSTQTSGSLVVYNIDNGTKPAKIPIKSLPGLSEMVTPQNAANATAFRTNGTIASGVGTYTFKVSYDQLIQNDSNFNNQLLQRIQLNGYAGNSADPKCVVKLDVVNPTATRTPTPTRTPTMTPSLTPTPTPLSCGQVCSETNPCAEGMICTTSSGGTRYCSMPEYQNQCAAGNSPTACCQAPTNTPMPTNTPLPTNTPYPTNPPPPRYLACGQGPCSDTQPCGNGLVCVNTGFGSYCAMPSYQAACATTMTYNACCMAPTNPPPPPAQVLPTAPPQPTPTPIVVLKEAGIPAPFLIFGIPLSLVLLGLLL